MMTVIILTALPSCHRRAEEPQEEEKNDTVYPLGFCTDSFDLMEGKVAGGEVFTGLMTRLGMTQADAMQLVEAADSVFEPRKMRAGNA